jgi:iron-sulfur cluster repair protein YtfE (RIC family)
MSSEMSPDLGDDPTWDETTRPTLAEPGDAPYSPAQLATADHLVQVHDHLRSELERLQGLVDDVRRGLLSAGDARAGVQAMTLRQNNWTLGAYCAAYCSMITQHHGLEDRAVFPHLRRADPGLVPVIDRLEQEHVIIHEVVEDVDRALVRLVRKPDDFTELTEAVDALTDTLQSHLAYEEQEITEPLSRFGFFPGQV